MSKSTISTFELFQMFPDAEAARVYMEGKRWPDEAYIGGKEAAKHESKRLNLGRGGIGKTAVIAGRERESGPQLFSFPRIFPLRSRAGKHILFFKHNA